MKFDIIGDIHGCFTELLELIEKLGYEPQGSVFVHPEGRNLSFVGDAMDRGPDSLQVLELLFRLQDQKILHYSPGNHCSKLYRYFKGHSVQVNNGLETTLAEWRSLSKKEQHAFRARYMQFYESLSLFQDYSPQLIVAHAGLKEEMLDKPLSRNIANFVLTGETTGKHHADGRPIRRDWAKTYKGQPWVVYGHTPTEEAYIVNRTVNIDTGCIFGGSLTALRFPELTLESVASQQPYAPERFHRFT